MSNHVVAETHNHRVDREEDEPHLEEPAGAQAGQVGRQPSETDASDLDSGLWANRQYMGGAGGAADFQLNAL